MHDYFPYELREEQKGFIEFLRKSIDGKNVCIHAPTGFGKTPLVLASLLPVAKERGLRIIWASKTGNETDRPIEELKKIKKKVKGVYGISFRGKREMCLLTAGVKGLTQDEASYICKTKGEDICTVKESLAEFVKDPLLYSEVLQSCKASCPYKVQKHLAHFADVVSLNYNYVLSEAISWAVRKSFSFSDAILVVDEAHNLPQAAMNMNSDSINYTIATRAMRELSLIDDRKARDVRECLKMVNSVLFESYSSLSAEDAVFDVERLRTDGIEEMVKQMEKFGNRIRKKRLEEGKRPSSSLHRLSQFLSRLFATTGTDGVRAIVNRKGIEIFDMRSREYLKDVWGKFHACVFLSGTMGPVEAFAETAGLENYSGKVFDSNFDLSRIRTFITSDLSTEGLVIESEMKDGYMKSIESFLSNTSTNSAIFFSSYRVQNELADMIKDISVSFGKRVFMETREMKGDEGRRVLDGFKSRAQKGDGLLLATMQGRFAEGADFPGRELENVFIVGVPFDRKNTRTSLLLDYNKKIYGSEKGTFYAYILPALRRASQSLGRALRSREDRALFVLGDRRYRRFLEHLPDYVQKTVVTASSSAIGKLMQENGKEAIKEGMTQESQA